MTARTAPPQATPQLTRSEWGRLSAMGLVIAALNAGGWGIFVFAIAPRHFQFRGLGLGVGVALTAWTLGARHAFDADHISAIDNTTRKLLADGCRPLGTGFFFALGHSSIIMAAGAGLAIAARAFFGAVVDPTRGMRRSAGSSAPPWPRLPVPDRRAQSRGPDRHPQGLPQLRRGLFDEEELERQLQARGLMYRFFGRFMRSITRTWHMFFVGAAFGIGFDTATEVLLLAATAAAATQGLPWYAVLSLPLLFAGGMTLFDTADGCFMNYAYGWAFARPVRKVYYNLVMTGLSIAVAFLIGTIEIIGLLSAELHIHGPFWDFMADFDINKAGFAIAGLFAVVWAVAVSYWKFGNIETRWVTQPGAAPAAICGRAAPGIRNPHCRPRRTSTPSTIMADTHPGIGSGVLLTPACRARENAREPNARRLSRIRVMPAPGMLRMRAAPAGFTAAPPWPVPSSWPACLYAWRGDSPLLMGGLIRPGHDCLQCVVRTCLPVVRAARG